MTNLPENWAQCKLDAICSVYQSKTISTKELVEDGRYAVYGANGEIGRYNKYNHTDSEVLITCRGATCGRINVSRPFSWINGNAMVVHPHSNNLRKDFLYYYLTSINFAPYISGSAQPQITRVSLQPLKLPLPPLAEQGRIVAKIEELFAGIDAGVENLKAVKNQIAIYRQSVLKSFLSGFATDTLANHVDMCLGKMLDKEKNKGTLFPYLRNKNVRWKNFDLDDLLEMRFEESEEERYSIQRGDLVVCEGGEPGRCAVWENDNVIKFQKALHRLRPHDNMNVYFLMYVFMLNIQAKNWDRFFTGSTIKHLTGEALKNLQIPVPTLAEQERIVAEIESRFERADALETAVDRALNDAEKLKQAVLKKAFSGELVPQNPDDEPASVLLARIRAARAAEQRANPKKGKRK